MSNIEEIKSAIQKLGQVERAEIHDWLENLPEDQLELTEEFRMRIETSEQEMRQGS